VKLRWWIPHDELRIGNGPPTSISRPAPSPPETLVPTVAVVTEGAGRGVLGFGKTDQPTFQAVTLALQQWPQHPDPRRHSTRHRLFIESAARAKSIERGLGAQRNVFKLLAHCCSFSQKITGWRPGCGAAWPGRRRRIAAWAMAGIGAGIIQQRLASRTDRLRISAISLAVRPLDCLRAARWCGASTSTGLPRAGASSCRPPNR